MATSWKSLIDWPSGTGTLFAAMDASQVYCDATDNDVNLWPAVPFILRADFEQILVTAKASVSSHTRLSGMTRAFNSTTATTHLATTTISADLMKSHITDIQTAVNALESGSSVLTSISTLGTVANSMIIDDAATNTVVTVLGMYHKSTGTPASGLGARLELGSEDSAGNTQAAAYLDAWLTTVTDGAEVSAFALKLFFGGAAQDALTVSAGSNSATVGSGQTTVNLWNSTATTVNAFGAATAINIGATGGSNYTTSVHGMLIGNVMGASGYLGLRYSGLGTTSYAFMQHSSGATFFNAASGTSITFQINQSSQGTWNATGLTVNTDLAVNGGDFTSSASTFNLLTSSTTVNAFTGASTALTIGHASAKALIQGGLTIADAKDIALNTTTGTKIGTATSQKLGFWNATPIIQPASANQAALSMVLDVSGSDTVDKASVNANFTALQTLVNRLRTDLVSVGIIKGAA